MRKDFYEVFTPIKDEEVLYSKRSDEDDGFVKRLNILFYAGAVILAFLSIFFANIFSSFLPILVYIAFVLLLYNVKENKKFHKLTITNKRIWWQNRKETISLQWDEIKKCDISFGYKRSYWLVVYKIDGSKKKFQASDITSIEILSDYINKGYNEYLNISTTPQEIKSNDVKPIMDYNEIISRPMWKTHPLNFILGIIIIIMVIIKMFARCYPNIIIE